MRIGLIGPQGALDSRDSGETDAMLERLIARLQKAGHQVLLLVPGGGLSAVEAAPFDLYVALVCDSNGSLTAASVSRDDATILLQAG